MGAVSRLRHVVGGGGGGAQRSTMNEKLPGSSVELTSLETTSMKKRRE